MDFLIKETYFTKQSSKYMYKEKREEIWPSPLTKVPLALEDERQETTYRRQQNLRLHNDCGPTKDGQLA